MSDLNDEKAGWTVDGLLGAVERLTRRAEAADAEVERWCVEYGRQHDRADRLAAENRDLRARLAAVEALADDLARVGAVLIGEPDSDGEYETGKALEAVVDDLNAGACLGSRSPASTAGTDARTQYRTKSERGPSPARARPGVVGRVRRRPVAGGAAVSDLPNLDAKQRERDGGGYDGLVCECGSAWWDATVALRPDGGVGSRALPAKCHDCGHVYRGDDPDLRRDHESEDR